MPCLPRLGHRMRGAPWLTLPTSMRPRGLPAAWPGSEFPGALACVAVLLALVCAACGGSGRPTTRTPLLQPTPDALLSAVVSGRATLVPSVGASPSMETEVAQAPPAPKPREVARVNNRAEPTSVPAASDTQGQAVDAEAAADTEADPTPTPVRK